MKISTYTFIIGNDKYIYEADSAGDAMTKCNRQVVDKLNLHPMAWMDTSTPNTWRLASGNFYD